MAETKTDSGSVMGQIPGDQLKANLWKARVLVTKGAEKGKGLQWWGEFEEGKGALREVAVLKRHRFGDERWPEAVEQGARQVKNPFEDSGVVGITNYIDFGFELQSRVDDVKKLNDASDSTFQVAASWQANKNFLLKGKVGPLSSSVALAFKSWWKPSFTFNISATRDRLAGTTALGFGICVENIREASYQRADPNFVMLTPNKEHVAEGISWKTGKRPMLQSDVNAGNFESLPRQLRPLQML